MPKGGHARVGPLPTVGSSQMLHGRTKRAASVGQKSTAVQPVEPPASLGDEEREVWASYAPRMAAEGRLDDRAREVLGRYCHGVVRYRQLKAELAEAKSIIISTQIDGAGNERIIVKANPLDAMVRAWFQALRALENDLLLSPAAYLRVPVPPADEPDPFADDVQ